jgi:Icc-related predicted phosphoesterase
MRAVCISDTHCKAHQIEIPDGDILIHSGDLTFDGSIRQISQELVRLSKHRNRFKEILLCEGNHDWLGERDPQLMDQLCKENGITILRDSGTIIDGINFYGSPWQPEFCNWAFNKPRGEALKQKWDLIPDNTNVLITHSPPMGILDGVERFNGKICEFEIEHVGCEDLYNRVMQLKDLKLHVFGHIHWSYGQLRIGNTDFVNAAICTEQYKPTNLPIVVEI